MWKKVFKHCVDEYSGRRIKLLHCGAYIQWAYEDESTGKTGVLKTARICWDEDRLAYFRIKEENGTRNMYIHNFM